MLEGEGESAHTRHTHTHTHFDTHTHTHLDTRTHTPGIVCVVRHQGRGASRVWVGGVPRSRGPHPARGGAQPRPRVSTHTPHLLSGGTGHLRHPSTARHLAKCDGGRIESVRFCVREFQREFLTPVSQRDNILNENFMYLIGNFTLVSNIISLTLPSILNIITLSHTLALTLTVKI